VSTGSTTAAARTRSWYLLHVLAVLTLLLVVFLLGVALYFRLTHDVPSLDLPLPVRVLGFFSVIALLWLWVRMLIDFFRERPAKYPVAWGWALFLGSYIGALAYFWIVWRSRNRPTNGGPLT